MAGLRLYLLPLLSVFHLISLVQSQNATAGNSNYTRIVGGDDILAPVPYQISFQRWVNNQWRHFCGGSIISPDFFLTAAHCVQGEDPAVLSALAGVTSLKSDQGSRHLIQGYQMHEEYLPIWKCDIAIVKVYPPFQLNKVTIDAISFTDTTPVPGGVPVVLTGWGARVQSGRGPLPDNLQVLITNTMDNKDCQQSFPKLQGTEICTFRSKQKGACNGDSGGPLASADMTKLVGIVAFGSKNCASGYPDFFTRMSEFVGWVQQQMALP